jgi:beta-1,4-mannosyltransferase
VRIFSYFWKVLLLTFSLLSSLTWRGSRKPRCVLVQNPPSIPALPVLWFYSLVVGARLVVDWHNYGHTILALALGRQEHALVKLCRWTEFTFGRRAHASFCVTKAMATDLRKRGVTNDAVTLYDRPGSKFKSLNDGEKIDFLVKMGASFPKAFLKTKDEDGVAVNKFVDFGEDGAKKLRSDRPGIVVSSTSWTEDEDFQMFLTALERKLDCDVIASRGLKLTAT